MPIANGSSAPRHQQKIRFIMTDEQAERYYRQILLKEIGAEGQRRLMAARVLVVGAGGLGSPAALYLAAAGVGRLGIADFDAVDRSNLQRQILHSTQDVGKAKVESAVARIADVNPNVTVAAISANVHAGNVQELIRPWDFVIDGTDNAAAKYLINDACVIAGKPYSHAGVLRFRGQTTTYVPGQAPCLRCIFPYSQEHAEPSCDTAGVIGGVCGVIGTLQAMEAVKYIVGAGELLTGRLLVYDALKASFHEVRLPPPDDNCPVCGTSPSITQPIDLETCSRRLLFRQML